MSKIHYLSLSAILLSSSAWSMKFSTLMMPFKQPVNLSTEQPPAIKYTQPGTIIVGAHRLCGDSDVANFSSSHPEFEFVPHDNKKIDVLIGYWVVENGATGSALLPSESNWYPIANQKIDIAENQANTVWTGQFNQISHAPSASNVNVMKLLQNEIKNLQETAILSYGSTKQYRIFSGAFACVDPSESSELDSTDYAPSPVDTVLSLKVIEQEVNSAFNGQNLNQIIQDNRKLKISLKSSPTGVGTTGVKAYDLSLGNHGENLEGAPLYDTYKKILELDNPPAATDGDSYRAAMAANSLSNSIGSGLSGDKIDYCNNQGATSNKTTKTYKYEAFPLNLSCKKLIDNGNLSDSFAALFTPSDKLSDSDFKTAQKNLAKRFLMAAVYEAAQEKLENDAKVVHAGCFRKGSQSNLISRLISSYPLNFKQVANKFSIQTNPSNIIHPESLFALHDFSSYSANDAKAVWGQVIPSQAIPSDLNVNGILFRLEEKAELQGQELDFNAPININIKVRSVGGSCTMYC